MDKKSLRKQILNLRDAIKPDERFQDDEIILKKLLALKEYRDANTIFTFVSYRSEVDTVEFIKESIRRGKRVLVPIVDEEKKVMILSELKSLEELEKSNMGILEPKAKFVRACDPKVVDICITPGAVFDKNGFRIGYGGGFYDKMIPQFRKDALMVAIGYELQMVESVPHEEYDQKIDMLVTEKNIYKF